ncbi:hypothetical protein AB0425_28910 [Actinosynnema sp. NPDC051121]
MATGTAAVAATRTTLRQGVVRPDVDQQIEAIGRDAAAEPDSVVGRPTGGQVPADPFASLRGVAGWAVDYVAFLQEPIEQLAGDPQGVRATADAIRAAAERLRELAEAQRETLARPEGWTGPAKDAYQASMDALGDELRSMAGAVAAKGVVVENTGAMVQALREAVLHTVGQYSDSLVPGAINAYVFAPFTFGASIAMFLGSVVDSATQLGASIAGKMDDLNAALTRQVDRVRQLDGISDEIGRSWERFESVAGGEATLARTASRPLLQAGETRQSALTPQQALEARRAVAVEESEALRPMERGRLVTAEASQPMEARRLPTAESEVSRPVEAHRALRVEETEALRPMLRAEEPVHLARAEEPLQARHAVRAEPMVRAEAAVLHEAQPLIPATETAVHYRTAERLEAREVSATREAAVRLAEDAE